VGGAIFVRLDGRWQRSPLTTQDMVQQEKVNEEKTKVMTCSHLRDETVGGEMAGVYSADSENEHGRHHYVIWIGKNGGLPLKSELDMQVGAGGSVMHISTRYDYRDVRPPEGVR
jgi:hypothetical protein